MVAPHLMAAVRRVLTVTLAIGFLAPWTQALARQWRKIEIPHAKCGDGLPYSVFLSAKDERKLTVEFMGGGACWDQWTCFGPTPMTWIHPFPFVPQLGGGIDSDKPDQSPVSSQSLLFFPYCTGDVHLGAHVASYLPPFKVHHTGRLNVEMGLRHLQEQGEIAFNNLDSLTLYGASAGAIAALMHTVTIDPFLAPHTQKFVIADAPGMHWGKNFWERFTPDFRADVSSALEPFDMHLKDGDGNIAGQLGNLCKRLPDWQLGILQGSKDVVMSALFGTILPSTHARLVYGPNGLASVTRDPTDNCSSWIPDSTLHTFMLSKMSSGMKAGGKGALEFVQDILEGRGGKSYGDKP